MFEFLTKDIIEEIAEFTRLLELLRELSQDLLLVEELALVAVLEVLRDPLAHVPRQLPVSHVLLHLLHLLAVLPPRRVQALDQVGRVAQEHGVARGAAVCVARAPFSQVMNYGPDPTEFDPEMRLKTKKIQPFHCKFSSILAGHPAMLEY